MVWTSSSTKVSTKFVQYKTGVNEIPFIKYMIRCAIWYHLCNLTNVKNTLGCNFTNLTKSNTPSWVFFTFFKFKWYQIAERIIYVFQGISLTSFLKWENLVLVLDEA